MNQVIKTLIGISLTFFALTTSAQKEMSLLDCILYGQKNALNVKQQQYTVLGAEIDLKQNKQSRLPNLNGSLGANWNFGRTIDPTTNEFITSTFFANNYGVNSNVLLYNGSRLQNQIKQSQLSKEAALADILGTETNVALNIASAYVASLTAQENLKNAKSRVDVTKSQLEQIDKLISAGTRPRNDRLDILAQISLDEQDILGFQNMLDINLLGLKQAMNYNAFEEITLSPVPNVATYSDPDELTFEEVYNEAALIYLGGDVVREQIANMGIDIAKSAHYPSVFAGGNLGTTYSNQGKRVASVEQVFENTEVIFNNQSAIIGFPVQDVTTEKNPYTSQLDQNLSYGFGVNVSVPIYNNYQNKANVERAKLNALVTENSSAINRQTLRTTIGQVLTDARGAKKRLDATDNTLAAQKAAYENAQKRFALGAISTYDLVNSKNQFDSAEINQTIAKFDYLFKLKILDIYRGKPVN